jgi:predicted DNA-binding transcriptional regulator AlpA
MSNEAISIPEFCETHGISRAHFYNLMKRGLAPKTLVAGRRRLVSTDSACEWRRSMEALAGARSTGAGERS